MMNRAIIIENQIFSAAYALQAYHENSDPEIVRYFDSYDEAYTNLVRLDEVAITY